MALTDKLTAIGNAIRSKTGRNDPLTIDNMISEISSLEIGSSGFPNKMEWIIDTSRRVNSLISFVGGKFAYLTGSGTSDSSFNISSDGISWENISTGIPNMGTNLYYSDGIWLERDNNGKIYYTTNDLSNWVYSGTTIIDDKSFNFTKVNGIYYTLSTPKYSTYYSYNGKQWNALSNNIGSKSPVYANGVWLAGSNGSSVNVFKSTDGINWSTIEDIPAGNETRVIFINGTWFVQSGHSFYYSTDNASSWSECSNLPESCSYIDYFDNKYIAYSSSGYFYSYDAINWTFVDNVPYGSRRGFNDLIFWVSTSDGTFYYSMDFLNWKRTRVTNTYKVIDNVVTNGKIFVANARDSNYVYTYAYCPIFE